MNRAIVSLLVASALLSFTAFAAPGAAPGEFGQKGQFVPAGQVSLSSVTTKAPSGGSSTDFNFTFAPRLGYFVIDNVLVGANVYGAIRSPDSGSAITSFGIGVHGGYNFNLMAKLSILPELSFDYGTSSMTISGEKYSSGKFGMAIFVPVLWHPVPHFFVGMGPLFSTDLTSSDSAGGTSADGSKTTIFGLASTIGGWL